MCGMLYAVTADVARWLRTEARGPTRKIGSTGEDFLLRAWLHAGKRGANSHACLWQHCYDLPQPSSASQNALPPDPATRRHNVANATLASTRAAYAQNREQNREDGIAELDESAGHLGSSARIDTWRRYGHRMLAETVVVHNIKATAEWLAISAYYERYRQAIGRAAIRRQMKERGSDGLATGAWTVPLQPYSREAKRGFYQLLGLPLPEAGSHEPT